VFLVAIYYTSLGGIRSHIFGCDSEFVPHHVLSADHESRPLHAIGDVTRHRRDESILNVMATVSAKKCTTLCTNSFVVSVCFLSNTVSGILPRNGATWHP
jgi:hypothetical protein